MIVSLYVMHTVVHMGILCPDRHMYWVGGGGVIFVPRRWRAFICRNGEDSSRRGVLDAQRRGRGVLEMQHLPGGLRAEGRCQCEAHWHCSLKGGVRWNQTQTNKKNGEGYWLKILVIFILIFWDGNTKLCEAVSYYTDLLISLLRPHLSVCISLQLSAISVYGISLNYFSYLFIYLSSIDQSISMSVCLSILAWTALKERHRLSG